MTLDREQGSPAWELPSKEWMNAVLKVDGVARFLGLWTKNNDERDAILHDLYYYYVAHAESAAKVRRGYIFQRKQIRTLARESSRLLDSLENSSVGDGYCACLKKEDWWTSSLEGAGVAYIKKYQKHLSELDASLSEGINERYSAPAETLAELYNEVSRKTGEEHLNDMENLLHAAEVVSFEYRKRLKLKTAPCEEEQGTQLYASQKRRNRAMRQFPHAKLRL